MTRFRQMFLKDTRIHLTFTLQFAIGGFKYILRGLNWIVSYKKWFRKDIENAKSAGLVSKIRELVAIVIKNPFQTPPPYEKLHSYPNAYSRRINEQHRLVYIVSGDTIELDRFGDIMSEIAFFKYLFGENREKLEAYWTMSISVLFC